MHEDSTSRPHRRIADDIVFPDPRVPIRASRHLLVSDIMPHDHAFLEVVIVVAGSAAHQTIHGRARLTAGDAMVIHPGAWHAYRDCRRLALYNCYVGMSLIRHQAAWAFEDEMILPLLTACDRPGQTGGVLTMRLGRAVLRSCVAQIKRLIALRGTARADRLALLLQALSPLGRTFSAGRGRSQAPTPPHPAVVRVVDALRADLTRRWTLADMAAVAKVAPSYLVRLHRAIIGESPVAHLTRLRIERAAALLLSTGRPIGDIGADVGILDANYFARRFRAHFGCTATAYRQRGNPGPVARTDAPTR